MEDINQGSQATTDPSSSSPTLERRSSGDEDPASMTIEFLRARLLSERSVSKAARQRAHQLAKKVSELEERLDTEIQLRRKLEADRLDILSKYRAELSVEYGDFFASSFGEGFSRNESAPESPNATKHDINEGFLAYTPNEDEEGLSISRAEQLERSDSSQQFNREETNDDDDEIDHSGREKGVLSWEKRKGLRKEFGYGTDWLGRSLSQRSLTSGDGESPQKRWAGKSVRQIRKRESRHYDTNYEEGEPGQSQVSEDFDSKGGQPDDMKEPLQCEDERDTEVERVLERQAELIEQFEAEENAQRAWEAKFKEGKALANYKMVNTQSNPGSALETGNQNKSLAEDDAAKLAITEATLQTHSVNEGTTRQSRKVHPEDHPSNLEGVQIGPPQSDILQTMASEDTSGTESEDRTVLNATVENKALFTSTQNKVGSTASGDRVLEEGQSGVVESTEVVKSSDKRQQAGESSHGALKKDLSQDQAFSNTGIEERVEPVVELGNTNKYRKHLSSSFKFTVFADADSVTSSPPQIPGFATHKQDMDKVEQCGEVRKEEVPLNGLTTAYEQVAGVGFFDARHHDPHYPLPGTASHDHHISADHPLPSGDYPVSREEFTEAEEKAKDILHQATLRREQLPPHWASENGAMDYLPNHDPGSNLSRDSIRKEVLKRATSGEGDGQDMQPGRHYLDFRSHLESRGLGGVKDPQPGLGRHYSEFPSHSEFSAQQLQIASKDMEGANFDNFRSGMPGLVSHANAYEDPAFRNHRRSVDGSFDRVADVLRALQIAKHQVQSSNEQAPPFVGGTAYRNGYDDRDAFYVEPPHHPSVYAAPSQYASSGPYPSRGSIPFPQNMQGWGAVPTGYGAGPSRQLANAPYMPYASRMPEPRNLWPPPPSQGVHSSMYHYDARQPR